MRSVLVAAVIVVSLLGAPAPARAGQHAPLPPTIHGLVFDDTNGDGVPSAGEHGVPNAVVALDVRRYAVTDATGQFDIAVPDGTGSAILWVRVPDGFRPGPVWARWDAATNPGKDVDLALHRLTRPALQPLTFVVAADSHLSVAQEHFGPDDLASAAAAATALDPAPAFFTVLGDVTQGSRPAEYAQVDQGLAGLGVPFVPVPGNHDWYDEGTAWFAKYGPDNYSFDLAGVHFVVWNMAMTDDHIRQYLGDELSRVDRSMPVVALTHAPPSTEVVAVLRELGVDYLLTGHTHTNRVVDHGGGLVELNTEPLIMGGLDFTPAGYRVVTIDGGRLRSVHRSTVDVPLLHLAAPAKGACVKPKGGELVVAAELDAGEAAITARVDCATPIALTWAGGWDYRAALPPLARGSHALVIEAHTAGGTRAVANELIEVCDPPAPAAEGTPWTQLGGNASHSGAREQELAPPLATRWTTAVGGHVLAGAPAIANGMVYVAVTDLGDGNTGGVAALDLATGELVWRIPTQKPLRGAPAVVPSAGVVVAAQVDGEVIALDLATGVMRWQYALSTGFASETGAVFGAPAADGPDILVGHQRNFAALDARTGAPTWLVDPVPEGVDSQSLAAVAIGKDVAVGTFNRAIGGVAAWDRDTAHELWRFEGPDVVAVNASPVIDGDSVYVVTGADEVFALDLANGAVRWRTKLDKSGFDWGNATLGTPAIAHGVLLVPTLYADIVALDAATGVELWRKAGSPTPLHTTHYRGAHESGFEASPVITGDIAWIADTAGEISARDLATGELLWRTRLDLPVLAGMATSGGWLVIASFDGTVRALAPGKPATVADLASVPACTDPDDAGGCCEASSRGSGASAAAAALVLAAILRRRPSRRARAGSRR